MYAREVKDAQIDLQVRLQDEDFRYTLQHTLAAAVPGSDETLDNALAETLLNTIQNHVNAAEAYHVSAEMSDLVVRAASVLEPEDVVDLSLPPTGCGIVRFDKPLPVQDVRGKSLLVHWVTWGPGTLRYDDGVQDTGIVVSFWNDLYDEPDSVARAQFEQMEATEPEAYARLRRTLGRWATVSASVLLPGVPLGEEMYQPSEVVATNVQADGDQTQEFTNLRRYVHALWLLLNQTIVSVSEESLTGPFKKRARKKNLPARVTVVSLRRTEGQHQEGESSVEWHHRWVVRGHWRWQAYGSGRTERRRIWIHPHVKGPDGAPLKVTEKVYSFHR